MDRLAPASVRCLQYTQSGLTPRTLTVFVIRVSGLALVVLYSLILTRWLGLAAYGQYSYTVAWVTILAIPSVGMGTLTSGKQRSHVNGRTPSPRALLRWASLNTLWVGGVLMLGGLAFLAAASRPDVRLALTLGLVSLPLACFRT